MESHQKTLPAFASEYHPGLTKREYFSAIAMQGLLQSNTDNSFDFIAKKAIEMADVILDKL